MHATTLLLTGLLSLTALATPVPAAEPATTNTLVRRTNTCLAEDGVAKRWVVTLNDDASHNGACGSGCLDNIRGRCGAVTNWQCERNSGGVGIYHFSTSAFCTLNDMTSAIKACSGVTIDCSNGVV